ncbi:MAG TPA: EAL domain-containing protein [Fibrobacteria bacterium]|nr:EAL domain-containing protein [Fibrobacteria bacterium]
MSGRVSILHLEDEAADAEYFAEALREAGLECEITLARDRGEFQAALTGDAPRFDLILSDNTLPGFSGSAALEIAKAHRPELPFIFLSGSIGEEAAIETLKNGATDYVLKSRTSRLLPAITRALQESFERRERKRAEEALRISEERLALAALGANDGLWDWDLKTGAIFFSARWKTMLGYREEEIGADPEEWLGLIHPEEADMVRLQIDRHLKGNAPKLECEYRIRTRQGDHLWVLCRGMAIRDPQGVAYRMAGSQGDVTERKRAEEQLLYDAFHDSLTGLFNRNLFLNRLQRLLWAAKRKEGRDFSVILLGLDKFGSINDGLGREMGDLIMKTAARRIEGKMRPGDTLARMGGDEFAVLIEDAGLPGDTVRMVQVLQDAFSEAFRAEDHEAFVSVSAGIVNGTPDYQAPEPILRDAGIALGKAKSLGKSRFAVFDAGMRAQALAILKLETDLRRAIERNEFRVHYQPILSLASDRITGFEALVRWQHPTRGLVPPMEFIPFAEESHFINEIGKTVLNEACARMKSWQRGRAGRRDLTISVNVSGKQFRQPDLIRQIEHVLASTGLDPECLKLEITETAIMDDPDAAAQTLLALRDKGISLQIDDFGTGFSSLGYLHKFPMQALKIDRSFVNMIGQQGENAEISSTIIAMAHNLGMQVIAEGIETPMHLRCLKEMGCEFGQGFLFSRPVDETSAEKLIAAA